MFLISESPRMVFGAGGSSPCRGPPFPGCSALTVLAAVISVMASCRVTLGCLLSFQSGILTYRLGALWAQKRPVDCSLHCWATVLGKIQMLYLQSGLFIQAGASNLCPGQHNQAASVVERRVRERLSPLLPVGGCPLCGGRREPRTVRPEMGKKDLFIPWIPRAHLQHKDEPSL